MSALLPLTGHTSTHLPAHPITQPPTHPKFEKICETFFLFQTKKAVVHPRQTSFSDSSQPTEENDGCGFMLFKLFKLPM